MVRRISATSASRSSRRSTALILQRKANVSAGWSNSWVPAPLAERLGPLSCFVKGVFRAREQEEERRDALLGFAQVGRHLAAKGATGEGGSSSGVQDAHRAHAACEHLPGEPLRVSPVVLLAVDAIERLQVAATVQATPPASRARASPKPASPDS